MLGELTLESFQKLQKTNTVSNLCNVKILSFYLKIIFIRKLLLILNIFKIELGLVTNKSVEWSILYLFY